MTGFKANISKTIFYIPRNNYENVIKAIKNIKKPELLKKISFLDVSKLNKASNVKECFESWGWNIHEDSIGIFDLSLPRKYLADDEFLFEAIAPYVKNHSCIEFILNDNYNKDVKLTVYFVNKKIIITYYNCYFKFKNQSSNIQKNKIRQSTRRIRRK